MREQKKVIPKAGMVIPLPDGNGNLPAEGKVVVINSYWYQRLRDGDVRFEDVAPEAEAPVPADAPTESSAAAPADAPGAAPASRKTK